MSDVNLLIVGGTHGNEVNACWLLDEWRMNSSLINSYDFMVYPIIGNPAARKANCRYIDRDLNRSFRPDLLSNHAEIDTELSRARELLDLFGPQGRNPCGVAIDMHSTTASMGNSLVVYGRRPSDLALASLVQGALGLPIYLHESDPSQSGFLVERWPCGLVIEVGPVSQLSLDARIVFQTKIALQTCIDSLADVKKGKGLYPKSLILHRHLFSLDYPRYIDNKSSLLLSPTIQGCDWSQQSSDTSFFVDAFGESTQDKSGITAVPVFINEVAYAEKHIALSLTKREVWKVEESWKLALSEILN